MHALQMLMGKIGTSETNVGGEEESAVPKLQDSSGGLKAIDESGLVTNEDGVTCL